MTRVLVVHHDVDIADVEADGLRRMGYEVDQCTEAVRPPLNLPFEPKTSTAQGWVVPSHVTPSNET